MIMRIVLFVLTLFGVGALYGFCTLIHVPAGWVTLAISIAVAEWLIRRHGFRSRGVEEALWIGGLIAFIVSLPSSGKPEAILAFVAAFAVAGARLRNALFGTIAIVLVIVYLRVKDWPHVALAAGVAIGLVAALLSRRSLFALTAFAAPFVAYLTRAEKAPELPVIATFLVLGAIDLAIGIRARERAPLIAGAMCLMLAAFEAQELIPISDEAKLILAGAVMLAIASALMRALRERTTGIVVTPVEKSEVEELLQMGASVQVSHDLSGAPPAAPAKGGGGEFGGAGASGEY